jgi:RNA polymerase sigma-70 factor (ECF subfamily)
MTFRDMTITETQARALAQADVNVALQMDEDAFRGFYDRTSRMLWVYLQRLTGDRSQADDLMQESYYRFLRASVTLESESHRRHYLFRIATNLARDRFRRQQTQPLLIPHDATDVAAPPAASTGAVEGRMDLASAMSKLKKRERALLWLAYAQGASHREIAEVVGVATSSVKPLLYRARRRLALLLGREGGAR